MSIIYEPQSLGEIRSPQEIKKVCTSITRLCNMDPQGRVLLAGSIAERLQKGNSFKDAVKKAHDVDMFLASERFDSMEESDSFFKELLVSDFEFETHHDAADGWWERTQTLPTEFGGNVRVIHIEDLAYSNISAISTFIDQYQQQPSRYIDPTRMIRAMNRLIRQTPHLSLFKDEAMSILNSGINTLSQIDLYKGLANSFRESINSLT